VDQHSTPRRLFSILSGLSGITGVILLGVSFATAVGPPPDATRAELVRLVRCLSCFLHLLLFTSQEQRCAWRVG
jgi:hypothetical protein